MKTKRFRDNPAVVLAGDIGGTKTTLGLFARDTARPCLLAEETFPSRDAQGIEPIIERMLSLHPMPVAIACFGVAGPVSDNSCKLLNLPWTISSDSIRDRFGWEHVRLINDLIAVAHAVPHLMEDEVSPLKTGRAAIGGNIGLLAPGTGLGQAILVSSEKSYRPVPSEGGHADFAPTDISELDLWRFLHRRFGHVSIERVVSGPGLIHIYEWLKTTHAFPEADHVRSSMNVTDPALVISENAGKGKDPLSTAALHRFCRILGAAAGNLALTCMAAGGIYLGGGIPPKIFGFLKESRFQDAFCNKGRFASFLENIPVWVITLKQAALLGAAIYGFNQLLGLPGDKTRRRPGMCP